jgi:hypothetical protein
MRKDVDTIFEKSDEGLVLIMDNPFGKMSSAHLMNPVMEIAKKYNVQFIAYTALALDSVLAKFDNVYHLETENIASAKVNIINARREVNIENIDKEELYLDSSRFKVEQTSMLDFGIE